MKGSRPQILATIGPASKDKATLRAMIDHGMDAARFNFSWGTHEEHRAYIRTVREVAKEAKRHVLTIQDLSGPRMQNGSDHAFDPHATEVLTPKDRADLVFGLDQGIEYVAQSFVGNAGDVRRLRREMEMYGRSVPIIAKIERKSALDLFDEILEVADAIMIARGDLGNEIPLEQIPFVEKELLEKSYRAGKPAIIATGLLCSMTEATVPTRAEVTDVVYALMHGSGVLMLSEETASGRNPLVAVETMMQIIHEGEKRGIYKEGTRILA